jgi:hypothetical protein
MLSCPFAARRQDMPDLLRRSVILSGICSNIVVRRRFGAGSATTSWWLRRQESRQIRKSARLSPQCPENPRRGEKYVD